MASRLFLVLALLFSVVFADPQLSREQECRIRKISPVRPIRSINSEGGTTELWNELLDQFQCAGIAALRNVLKPNALSLANYQPSPRLVYVERGQALLSLAFPGCAETFHDSQTTKSGQFWDLHQKVERIRAGDIVGIPAGIVHFCYNDGNEELVAVSINDLNHRSNQLDEEYRAFYLAGGVPTGGKEQQQTFQNVLQSLDPVLVAEAFNVQPDTIKKMQAAAQGARGLSVIAREPMRFLAPDEQQRQPRFFPPINGLEETLCSMDISAKLDNRRKADIFSRQAGKLTTVDRLNLPILKYIDLSAEKGNLFPNAMLSPDWAMLGHTIIYVTRGAAQIQLADNGRTVMNDRVQQGDMFVVPQFYTSTVRAGNEGFEWVGFKTTGLPMRNTVAGYTSVMRAMPLEVLTNAYQISRQEAEGLKANRGGQSYLLSPSGKKAVA